MENQIIKFVRRKDFELIKELGQGACGRTVLLNDPIIDEQFVCKKYSPMYDNLIDIFYDNFVKEIKFLHELNHPNIVRVFNYYLYPEEKTGYILMEYVSGYDIEDYLNKYPENIDSVFKQVIEAFFHLESHSILHRDIRPMNILVSEFGDVKVIDFGFSKKIIKTEDFDKSISLNWWCEPPYEFREHQYTHSTEVYFIGKLFDKIAVEREIDQFAYKDIITKMAVRTPEERIGTFSEVRSKILNEAFSELEFDFFELDSYRSFANQLSQTISKISHSSKYIESSTDILRKLEEAYKAVMLEKKVPTNTVVLNALINGGYYYSKKDFFEVSILHDFLKLLRHASQTKRNIIIANLKTRMNAAPRYNEDSLDDIPF
jgi:eukaryotic-like serine/threonine-protein kinase